VAWRRPAHGGEVPLGVGAGLLLASGYLFQTFGLRSTPSSTSAFITYLLVVIVPVIVAVGERRLPDRRTATGVVIAVIGLYLLSGSGADAFGWGEVLTLLCAVCFAGHLVAVSRGADRFDECREAVGVAGETEAGRDVGGAAGTGLVPGDDGARVREPAELRPPHAVVVARTVHEHERRSRSRALEGDLEPSRVDRFHAVSVLRAEPDPAGATTVEG